MISTDIESQLLSLSETEKTQVIQMLLQSNNDVGLGIKKTLDVCGGDACIRSTRIPVWVLVQARKLGVTEAGLLQDYPDLSARDLVNAFAYADSHQAEIEQTIRENNED